MGSILYSGHVYNFKISSYMIRDKQNLILPGLLFEFSNNVSFRFGTREGKFRESKLATLRVPKGPLSVPGSRAEPSTARSQP